MADSAANSATPSRVAPEPARRIRVLLPLPLPDALDYLAPQDLSLLDPGAFVRVSLGSRRLIGVVWEGEADGLPEERLKPAIEVLPTLPLRPELRRFIHRVAAYTLAPPGMVLKMAMSVEKALLPSPPRRICAIAPAGLAALTDAEGKTLTAARRRVLEALRDGVAGPVTEVARRAGCGPGVVRGLIAA
ncbi:MAG TPA: primosomal protein N', partial [Stellaceae bacterium]